MILSDDDRANLLLRFEALLSHVETKSITGMERDLQKALRKLVVGFIETDHLQSLSRRIKIAKMIEPYIDETYRNLYNNIIEDMVDIATLYSASVIDSFMDGASTKVLKFNKHTLIQDYELGDMILSNKTDAMKRFKVIIASAIENGDTAKQVVQEAKKYIKKKKDITDEVFVHSAIREARKQAKFKVYERLKKEGIVSKFYWLATLEANTCPICRKLDGKSWKKLEDIPKYPAHFRCRCTINAGINNRRAGVQYYKRKDGFIKKGKQFSDMNYDEWLQSQPKEIRDVVNSGEKIFKSKLKFLVNLK